MIDLHCHILPGVDDGSDSPDTSCRMAAQAARSGVSRIVATPHRSSDPARERGRSTRKTPSPGRQRQGLLTLLLRQYSLSCSSADGVFVFLFVIQFIDPDIIRRAVFVSPFASESGSQYIFVAEIGWVAF